MADMWLRVEYLSNFVVLHFVNKTHNKPEEIRKAYMSKRGHDRIYMYDRLGFQYHCDYFDSVNNLVDISISIPIIP